MNAKLKGKLEEILWEFYDNNDDNDNDYEDEKIDAKEWEEKRDKLFDTAIAQIAEAVRKSIPELTTDLCKCEFSEIDMKALNKENLIRCSKCGKQDGQYSAEWVIKQLRTAWEE